MAFAKKASETFTETNFIKGIGTLGVLGDRITESITPIKQMAETLPGILGDGLTNLINAVSNGLKRVKDPYALGVEPAPTSHRRIHIRSRIWNIRFNTSPII
jgi:hypothetical protein